MSLANQLIEAFHNASGGAFARGTVFRATTGVFQATTASAGALSTLAGVVGCANNATASGGVFNGVVGGEAPCLLIAGLTPVAGQTVYVSATAGKGTNVAPALALPIGTIVDASRYSIDSTVVIDIDTALVVTSGGTDPLWDISLCRYYFLDNENGNDLNVGYIDATPGTIFAAGDGAAVALKTSEELRNRLPRYGSARIMVALFKPRSDNGSWLNKAGATDYLDVGYGGYGYIAFKGSSDFTNSLVERVDLGGVNDAGSLGPNVDRSWTVSGQVSFTITVAAGTLPAQDALAGLKIKYAGNITAGLTATGNVALARTGATVFDVGQKTVAAANGDQFFIQTPGVRFANVVATGAGMNGPRQGLFMDPLVAGMRFSSLFSVLSGAEAPYNCVFCRFDADVTTQIRTTSFRLPVNYIDETELFRNVFCGGDFRSTCTLRFGFAGGVNMSAFHAATTLLFGGGDSQFLNTSYSLLRPDVQQLAGAPYLNSGTIVGTLNPAVFRPAKLVAGVRFLGGKAAVLAIDFDAATTGIAVVGNTVDLTIGYAAGSAGPSGTATGSALDLSGAKQSRVVIDFNASTGTTQDILMANSVVATFASLGTSPQLDDSDNIVQGGAGVPVKKTVMKFSGVYVGAAGAQTCFLADAGPFSASVLVATPVKYVVPACRIRMLRVQAYTNPLAASLVVRVLKNGAATGITATILAGVVTPSSDFTHEAQFNGTTDVLDIDMTETGVGTALISASVECF